MSAELTQAERRQWAEYAIERLKPKVIVQREDDKRGNRFYWWLQPSVDQSKFEIVTGIGITSLLSMVMPTSPFLTDWKLNNADWEQKLSDSAEYGTLMHLLFLSWLVKGEVDQVALEAAQAIAPNKDMPYKDLLAFKKFKEDYNVIPYIVEGMMVSEPVGGDNYYCQTIDLLCSLDVDEVVTERVQDGVYIRGDKAGQPKFTERKTTRKVSRIANIDFKSNFMEKERKSFYDSHLYQLIAARRAVHYNFPDVNVDIIANFSPNAWRTEPSYTLKVWEPTKQDEDVFDAYINIALVRGLFKPNGQKFVPLGFDTNSPSYEQLPYKEYIEKYKLNT